MKPENVPGTARQRVTLTSGKELQRQFIYLHPETWNKLTKLADMCRTSGSLVIEELINIASSDMKITVSAKD